MCTPLNYVREGVVKAWMYASKRPINAFDKNKLNLIDWNQEEAHRLFEKILNWWQREKRDLLEARGKTTFDGVVENRVHDVLYILKHVILPRFKGSGEDVKEKVFTFLGDLEASGFIILFALPATLYLDDSAEQAEKVRGEMHKGVHSRIEAEVREAIQSTVDWLAYDALSELPEAPPALLEDIALKLVARRQPMLQLAVNAMSWIVKHIPQVLNDSSLTYMLLSLQFLKEDTTITREGESINNSVSVEKMTRLRAEVAKLAGELYRYYRGQQKGVPEIIRSWEQLAIESPLPELRNGFVLARDAKR